MRSIFGALFVALLLVGFGQEVAAYRSSSSRDRYREGEIRLVNGNRQGEGRLEIYYDGEWGTVCDDRFNEIAADVVCNQLGFNSGTYRINGAYGYGRGRVWLDDVECTGRERRLDDCRHGGWGRSDCSHGEDVGVQCF